MPSKNAETYLFQNKRLLLIDPELGLNVDEPFDPLLLPETPQWGQQLGPDSFVTGNVAGTEFFVERHGRPDGQCRLYHPSRAVKGEMYYVDGKLHGPSVFLGEEGQVLARSWFIHGHQQGKVFWYYPDGKVYSLQRYKDGVYHGKQEYFRPDGTHKTVLTYTKGVMGETFLSTLS